MLLAGDPARMYSVRIRRSGKCGFRPDVGYTEGIHFYTVSPYRSASKSQEGVKYGRNDA